MGLPSWEFQNPKAFVAQNEATTNFDGFARKTGISFCFDDSIKKYNSQDGEFSEAYETQDRPRCARFSAAPPTQKNAVASFFKPASEKPPEKIVWQERAPNDDKSSTLLVGKYAPDGLNMGIIDGKRKKIAAFDFDSTLIQTSSGKSFTIVVISNQGGITLKPDAKMPKAQQSKVEAFKTKVSAVFSQLDIPISIYAATEKDIYRKPRTGMWTELLSDCEICPADLDLERSVFVGDAAGRRASPGQPKDFSCSDRNFAGNVGLTFHTPEEFFLGERPRQFTRTFEPSEYLNASTTKDGDIYTKKNECDIVLFCGSPGAGKSTFYWKQLEPLGYTRINQDILKSREKCIRVADDYLKEGKSVVIDNTNADPEVRSKWVQLAAKHNVPIRCVLFTAGSEICEHNDAVRALNDISVEWGNYWGVSLDSLIGHHGKE
ncbi:hypothetical protein EG329_012296 [Mollisiaceae sp. DMI_Dod_QoI]|nr:hypothetical protein EG329_012296 [Helotiales sp. DMI_Dod_QoI]